MKRTQKWILALLCLAVITTVFIRQVGKNTVSAAEDEPSHTAVKVMNPSQVTLEEKVSTLGELTPLASYNVMITSGGTVETTYFEVGDSVEKGDVLFKMETDSLSVQQDATKEQVSNAVAQAKISLDQAEDNYKKQKALYEQGAVSETTVTSAKTQVDNASIAYNNALTNQRSTEVQLKDQYDAYVQVSPISGKIVTKNIEAGQMVSSQVAYTIVPEDAFTIKTSVSSKDINVIARDQKAIITIPSLGKTTVGSVTSVSDVGSKGVFGVEVNILGNDGFKSGMYAEIDIVFNERNDVMVISQDALNIENGETYVYVINTTNVAEKRQIVTGSRDQGRVEILEGINLTDRVVVTGADFIEEGELVIIVD